MVKTACSSMVYRRYRRRAYTCRITLLHPQGKGALDSTSTHRNGSSRRHAQPVRSEELKSAEAPVREYLRHNVAQPYITPLRLEQIAVHCRLDALFCCDSHGASHRASILRGQGCCVCGPRVELGSRHERSPPARIRSLVRYTGHSVSGQMRPQPRGRVTDLTVDRQR
ncbi:hypothetical protein BDV95DRAFT_288876 [Massariosphaeria phaeospora]|uniref:Uncharacterized protein n=1 Tax=Massariosphaeria phaeospora TaxID=100035 RepID=A0A7C8MB98_9PLEO|nr:hypothetical protein BDV95DRAFT_288876 [Massariosphaeria phaeospora]